MKRVSYNIAKIIKEAGYPQKGDVHSTYYDEQHKETFVPFVCNRSRDYLAPTYMEVWLWLWREKKLYIDIDFDIITEEIVSYIHYDGIDFVKDDPEEAIIAAIEHLADNDLIK